MRRKSVWRAVLLTAGALLTSKSAFSQGMGDYAPPDCQLPLPLATTQPGFGGLYLDGEFLYFHQTNPLREQQIAFQGFIDSDGSVTGRAPGSFIGSGANVLDVNQVRGPETYEPGFKAAIGWKFEDGSTLSVSYLYIAQAQYTASATGPAPQDFQVGANLQNTFLTSFVYNFPNDFSGPQFKTGPGFGAISTLPVAFPPGNFGNPYALYGIWNGASIMTLQYVQSAEGVDITYRRPVYETETYRLSGTVGPRYFWIYDRFRWRTTDLSFDGSTSPTDVALYENITSNEMYGAFVGCENEWYLGHGFATYLNFDAAALVDHVKEKADYQLGVRDGTQNKRAILDYTFVPELTGTLGIAWYLAEGIQFRLDYNAMVFFNTIASPRPVSFNYGGLDPGWEHVTSLFDGFSVSLSINF